MSPKPSKIIQLPDGTHIHQGRADHAIRFIESLVLGRGTFAGQTFRLRDFQKDWVMRLFGAIDPEKPTKRQYSFSYYSTSRKQGKSGLLAACGTYIWAGSGIPGTEVISAAGSREQASIIFHEVKRFVENTPFLMERSHIIEHQKKILWLPNGSTFESVAAGAAQLHGRGPTCVLVDELHAWGGQAGHDLYAALATSQGAIGGLGPLFLVGTTAGPVDRTSIWWDVYSQAKLIRDGVIEDPTKLVTIYEPPPGADIHDRETWKLASPAIGDLCSWESLETAYRDGLARPSAMTAFQAYNLNMPVDQMDAWLDMNAWVNCKTYDDHELLDEHGQPLPSFGGFDAGWKSDFSSLVVVTPLADGRLAVRCRNWIPQEARSTTAHRPYSAWLAKGELCITDGAVVDFTRIEDDIVDLCEAWNIRELAYDPANMEFLRQRIEARLDENGWTGTVLVSTPQGYKLSPGLKALEDAVKSGMFCHRGHGVLGWMASNAVVDQSSFNTEIRLNKRRANEKVDAIAAASMSLSRCMLHTPTDTAPAPRRVFAMAL